MLFICKQSYNNIEFKGIYFMIDYTNNRSKYNRNQSLNYLYQFLIYVWYRI